MASVYFDTATTRTTSGRREGSCLVRPGFGVIQPPGISAIEGASDAAIDGLRALASCRFRSRQERDYRRVPILSLKSSLARLADPGQRKLEAGKFAETLTFGGDHIRIRVGNELFVRKLSGNTIGLLLGFCNCLLEARLFGRQVDKAAKRQADGRVAEHDLRRALGAAYLAPDQR